VQIFIIHIVVFKMFITLNKTVEYLSKQLPSWLCGSIWTWQFDT